MAVMPAARTNLLFPYCAHINGEQILLDIRACPHSEVAQALGTWNFNDKTTLEALGLITVVHVGGLSTVGPLFRTNKSDFEIVSMVTSRYSGSLLF